MVVHRLDETENVVTRYDVRINHIPNRLRSPDYVLRHQIGTCFELSTLLTSLLIGNGYDAYVVSGFATKQCCQNDQTYTECPKEFEQEFHDILDDDSESNKQYINFENEEHIGESKFWKIMEEKKLAEEIAYLKVKEEEENIRIKELEKIPIDEFSGKRVHSWVLVILNCKNIKFIESSTGVIYSKNENPYLRIESLWNNSNYWINMKPELQLSELFFDLTNLRDWERLLICEPWHLYSNAVTFNKKEDILILKHLEIPKSWVNQLKISKKRAQFEIFLEYKKRYPKGNKIIYFKKTRIEKFCEKYKTDGMILQITKYKDYNFKQHKSITRIFFNNDHLLMRSRIDLDSNKLVEEYNKGRKDSLEKLECMVKNIKPYWHGLKMKFYTVNRVDNLSIISLNRTDMKIINNCRSNQPSRYIVKFNEQLSPINIESLKYNIREIEEQYKNNNTNIRSRIFDNNRIYVKYHYKENEILPAIRYYVKNKVSEFSDEPGLENKSLQEQNSSNIENQNDLSELIKLERSAMEYVWNIISEVHDIYETRKYIINEVNNI